MTVCRDCRDKDEGILAHLTPEAVTENYTTDPPTFGDAVLGTWIAQKVEDGTE